MTLIVDNIILVFHGFDFLFPSLFFFLFFFLPVNVTCPLSYLTPALSVYAGHMCVMFSLFFFLDNIMLIDLWIWYFIII